MSTPKEPKELPPQDSKGSPVKVISKESLHRLLRDVKQIMMNPLTENGIYYQHCEEDMLKGNAMIIGPEDTPYYGGYYFFELRYPTDYPHSPPVVKFFTQGDQIRFNPNLYKSGKVCVSLLNTWRGEQWTSCQTITSILLTLCTLLCKNPILNEPGVGINHKDFKSYDTIITYKNIELSTLHLLNQQEPYYIPWFNLFYEDMVAHFTKNKDNLKTHLELKRAEFGVAKSTEIKTTLYGMLVSINYSTLTKYFEQTSNNIKKRLVKFKTEQEAVEEHEETQKL